MAMTEKEIASVAARRSAARRTRVTKTCPVCDTSFEGLTTRRYCSDRCRVRAGRDHRADEAALAGSVAGPPFGSRLSDEDLEQRPGENVAEFLTRLRRTVYGDQIFDTDAAELIRQERDARSEHLASLSKQ